VSQSKIGKTLNNMTSLSRVSEHVLRETSTAEAPWIVVEGEDANYRSLTVGKLLLREIRKGLEVQAERR
jgi:polyphosphate kinase 2 (PPK2 family)